MRDLLLKRPTNDIDFVCVGSGITLAQAVADKLGIMLLFMYIKILEQLIFHIMSLTWSLLEHAKESYRGDSRKPIVEDGTLQRRSVA